MKIIFIQHNSFLNGNGGSEKMCTFLANSFSEKGHEVSIAVNQKEGGSPVFPLNSDIKVDNIYNARVDQIELLPIVNYSGKNPIAWLVGKIKKKYTKQVNKNKCRAFPDGYQGVYKHNLKKRSEQWYAYLKAAEPDLIITMSTASLLEITYDNTLDIPIINSVNGRPDYDYEDVFGRRDPLEKNLLKNSYSRLSGIQILLDDYDKFLPDTFKGKVFVIGNPFPEVDTTEHVDHQIEKSQYVISHLGRLDNDCKQQTLAIEAFHRACSENSEWRLDLWGTGADRDMIQQKIAELALGDKVALKGFCTDPIAVLKNADIFLFPSRYEGFPLALGEAMSVGLPAIGLGSCSGVNKLIVDGESGYLVENVEAMAFRLKQLMNNSALRQEMGKRGVELMRAYTPASVLAKWDELINEIVER